LSSSRRRFVAAVREGDEGVVEEMVLRVSSARPYLAPLALLVGGFAMVFRGLRLLFTDWRLTLLQILPAMWIWLATYDLKAHVLHGKSFNVLRGPVLIPIVVAIVAITTAAFFLDAAFAFAISRPGKPQIHHGFVTARSHLRPISAYGVVVGLLLAFSTVIVTRWGHPWFGLCLSIVIGVLMVSYVTVPSRLIGIKPKHSRRDKLAASAVGVTMGAALCTPPYLLLRVGILMLGSRVLLIPGLLFIGFGATLQAGASGAVNAVKMSSKFVVQEADPDPTHATDIPLVEP